MAALRHHFASALTSQAAFARNHAIALRIGFAQTAKT
jgi:hypothetical protein